MDDSLMPTVVWYVGRALWTGGVMSAGIIALLWYFQEKLLFHPGEPPGFKTPDKNPAGLKHPGESGMEYEDVTITTDDNMQLHAWFIKQPSIAYRTAPTLLFFQGNAGNMGFRIPNISYLLRSVKVNILAISYRGYGWSTGSPSEPGLYKDAEAALFHLMGRSDIDQSKIFLFGRSIGGAVAIDLAARRYPVLRGVVVENTFTNLHEMADLLFPVFRPFRPLIRFIQRLSMDNKSKVADIQIPFLFISGLQDTLVPPEHMRILYETSSSEHKRLYKVQNGTHNETWHQAGAEYYEVILDFIDKASAIPPHHYQSSTAETDSCFHSGLSMELENLVGTPPQSAENEFAEATSDVRKTQ